MFQGFSPETIDFMWGLRFNNERSWFEAHREEYKTLLETPMRALGEDVFHAFADGKFTPPLQLHVCRIYRDARRLHGGGPYKDHLWFTIRSPEEEWTDKPVFWFELRPEEWNCGLGYYQARPLTMQKLRARIDTHPEPLLKLDRRLAKQSEFALGGEEYARPKCSSDAPLARWYNKKTVDLAHGEKIGETLFSPALKDRLAEGFTFLTPYFQYLASLDGDPDPRLDR